MAAYNVLSAILEGCLASQSAELRAICADPDLWLRVFTICLDRSDQAKTKSMRQVLLTLSSLLPQDHAGPHFQRVRDLAGIRLLSVLYNEEAHTRVKPALNAFEHLVAKRVLLIPDLIALLQARSESLPIERSRKETRLTTTNWQKVDQDALPQEFDTRLSPLWTQQAWTSSLLLRILDWIPNLDVAPAAGKLFASIVDQLRRDESVQSLYRTAETGLPVWVAPLQQAIAKRSSDLAAFKQHIFPNVFKLDPADILRLFDQLHFQDLRAGAALGDDTNTQFLMLALTVGKELGLVKEAGTDCYCNRRIGGSILSFTDSTRMPRSVQ